MNKWHKKWQDKCEQFKQRCFYERSKFMAALEHPAEAQRYVLHDIVNTHSSSKFGKQHGFDCIKNIGDFQQNVPIRSYELFVPWLNEEVERKIGVITARPVIRWLKTSGSTGDSKKIPYTDYWMANYRVPALCVLWANYIQNAPEMLFHPYATLDTQTVREHPTEFLNEVPYQGITNRNYVMNPFDWEPPWYDAPWFNADVPAGYDNRMYYRLQYFLGQDLRAIFTINPSTLIAMRDQLVNKLPQLIREINDGTILGQKMFTCNPDLAKSLEQYIGKDNLALTEIWPKLSLISCWTSASAKLYLPKLAQIFPNVRVLPFMSCGTEGIVTLPIDDHVTTGPLAVTQGFYEFLPASEDIDAVIKSGKGIKALLFNQLEPEKEYHLVMTQGSGMCRYAVGDLFKVVGFYNGVPRIEYSRRHGTYYSFTGEKLTEKQLLMVMGEVMQKYYLDGGLFMCCPVWGEPPFYKMLIEVDANHNQVQFKTSVTETVDYLLRKYNEEYDSKRKSNRLGAVKIFFIKKGTLDKFQEQEKQNSNAIQYKYKPFQKNEAVFNQIVMAGGYGS